MKRTLNNNCQALPWDDDIYFQYLQLSVKVLLQLLFTSTHASIQSDPFALRCEEM